MTSDNTLKDKGTNSSVVAKAGIWFTICNFIFRGMSFFTVPFFTRLLSKGDVGSFSNYSSWISILIVITSLDLSTSIIRSKVEHENDIDSYIWSILSFSTLFTLVLYFFAIINQKWFAELIQMDIKYVHLMFLYFLTAPAYSMLITKHRAFYKYKLFVLLTGIVTVSSTFLSLFLTITFDDKLWGRALGQYTPSIIIGAAIFVFLAIKGKGRINFDYWKYALIICVPLVPHTLSSTLLGASDRVIITQQCGSEATALYSVASNCYHIVTILLTSMNTAWTPWLFEKLKNNQIDEIKSFSRIYIIFFSLCAWGVMLMGPELVLIFGGKSYNGAIYCLVPLMTSCIFQFMYLFYVNAEFYTKKTIGVAFATIIAAGLNIALNLLLIPLYPGGGHIIASYTTLVGYFVLLILHYFLAKRLNVANVFDTKIFIKLGCITWIMLILINLLYRNNIIRYIVLLLYVAIFLFYVYSKRSYIKNFLFKKSD